MWWQGNEQTLRIDAWTCLLVVISFKYEQEYKRECSIADHINPGLIQAKCCAQLSAFLYYSLANRQTPAHVGSHVLLCAFLYTYVLYTICMHEIYVNSTCSLISENI